MKMNVVRKKISALKKERDEKELIVERLENTLNKEKHETQLLEDSNRSLERQMLLLEQELEKERERRIDFGKKLTKTEMNRESFHDQLMDASNLIAQLEVKLDKTQAEKEQRKAEFHELEKDLEEMLS